jgi:ribose transport system permease protein
MRRLIQLRELGILAAAVALFVALSLARPETFFTEDNILRVAMQISLLTILATGMTYLFIAGELDLSIGSLYGLGAILMASFIVDYGIAPWGAAALVLALGLVVGIFNGFVTTVLGVPSFIVTLGMLSLLRGITLVLSGAFPIDFSSGYSSSLFSLVAGHVGDVPAQVFWMLGIGLVGALVLKLTRFGYHVYATGGNPRAARAMGIDTRRVKVACFVLTALLTALVAVIQGGWLRSGDPTTGIGFELNVIGAVIIGGVALTGGEGSVYGTLVGAAILGMLSNGIVLLGVNGNWNQIFIGAIIVAAGSLDVGLRRVGGLGTALARIRGVRVVEPAREEVRERPKPSESI